MAAPFTLLQQRGTWDYLACLHRCTQKYQHEYWLNHIREPLPFLRVPLLEGEPDAVLDLQAVFDRAYDSGRYAQEIDYADVPAVPVTEADTAWMEHLLHEKNLRI